MCEWCDIYVCARLRHEWVPGEIQTIIMISFLLFYSKTMRLSWLSFSIRHHHGKKGCTGLSRVLAKDIEILSSCISFGNIYIKTQYSLGFASVNIKFSPQFHKKFLRIFLLVSATLLMWLQCWVVLVHIFLFWSWKKIKRWLNSGRKLEFKFGIINYSYNPRPLFDPSETLKSQLDKFVCIPAALKPATQLPLYLHASDCESLEVAAAIASPSSTIKCEDSSNMLMGTKKNRERFAIKKSYSIEVFFQYNNVLGSLFHIAPCIKFIPFVNIFYEVNFMKKYQSPLQIRK